MNILLTTHVFPWPVASGATIRTTAVLHALARLGRVDVVCLVDPGRIQGRVVPAGEPVARVRVLGRPPRRDRQGGPVGRVRWLLDHDRPLRMARDYAAVRDQFAAWGAPDYDLVWLGGPEGFVAFGDLLDAPMVCNFDDLEDRKLASRAALGAADRAAPRRSPAAAAWAATRDRVDQGRWQSLHRQIAARCARLVVCSPLEEAALRAAGCRNVEVAPNVYPEPACPAGRATARTPPTFTFVGVLTYEPNIDAARFLVGEVLPALRRRLGEVEVRLVGAYDHRVADLAAEPGVTLTGAVPEMGPELARTDVVAVPIRFGGGTRVKILEAFAHGIPVVSTRVGAEGLDVDHATHLLLADAAEPFADACVDALDGGIRAKLRAGGHERWRCRHRPDALGEQVTEIVAKALR